MVQDKKVIDQVSGWLTVFEDGSVDRTWTGPPEAKFVTDPVPPHHHFIDGVAVTDITTDRMKFRIYLPKKQENDPEKLPVLLHFHGGGFCVTQPDLFTYYHTYTRLSRTARAVVVSPFLRRAPEHRLPAPCEDGVSALLWLRSLSRGESHEPLLQNHADFNRVFLIGDSSGANIVHYVASHAGNEDFEPLRISGAIPMHPGFVRAQRSRSELEQPETQILTLEMVDKLLALALPLGETKDYPITCPMGEAAPPIEGVSLPPYLYCVAEQDLMRDTQMEFYEAMKSAGKDVELLRSRGVGHCFYLNKMAVERDPATAAETERLFEGIKGFIEKHR